MADKTITALTGASTPLAGTEVLPIVQSGATVKVAVSNLTAGRAVATAALSATGIVLTTDATDASSTTAASLKTAGGLAVVKKIYVGDNIVPAAAKGVNFTANTPAAGMTSQLLNWYEEGTFTPTAIGSSPAGTTTYTAQTGTYTRIGNLVTFRLYVVSTVSAGSGGALIVGGLPFASSASAPASAVSINLFNTLSLTAGHVITGFIDGNQSFISFRQYLTGGGAVAQVSPQPVGFAISGQYNI
jgi:hypothetical protein